MKRTAWRERVIADPEVHHGEPCITGTRIPVRIIVGSLADGLTAEQIVAEYPQLTPEDVSAALAFAAEVLHQESLVKVFMTMLENSDSAGTARTRGAAMAAALEGLAAAGGPTSFGDAAEWERDAREDRTLPDRES
ncbi:MAG TPA: DUF433 domain-containing protein [Thermoanaerobaculia bacterium]|jgi:uncharacterized protein (DUF433 family)